VALRELLVRDARRGEAHQSGGVGGAGVDGVVCSTCLELVVESIRWGAFESSSGSGHLVFAGWTEMPAAAAAQEP
jgi:hypothetical protein